MSATENEYGPNMLTTPYLSPSSDAALDLALLASHGQESPDGWSDDIAVGASDEATTDTITWGEQPCTAGRW